MSINFSCKFCGKTLVTPEDKAGKRAKCPGCGEVITIPQASPPPLEDEDHDDHAEDSHEHDDEEPVAPPPVRKKRPTKNCPMCGETVGVEDTECEHCGEELEAATSKGGKSTFTVGASISDGWEIFKKNMGILVGAFVIAQAICLIPITIFYMLLFLSAHMREAGDFGTSNLLVGVAFTVYFLGIPLMGLTSIGQIRLNLDIAKGNPGDLKTLFLVGRYCLRLIGILLVFFLLLVLLGMVLGVVQAVFRGPIGGLLSMLIMFGVLMYGVVTLSFWMHLLADRNCRGITCLQEATLLVKGHFWDVLLFLLINGFIAASGVAALCVGLFFTVPLSTMIFTVAYLRLSGQRVVV